MPYTFKRYKRHNRYVRNPVTKGGFGYLRGRPITKRFRAVSRGMISKPRDVHWFKRTFSQQYITSGLAPQNLSFSFMFNQLVNSSEYTDLFDQYCLKKLIYKFERCFNSVEMATSNQTPSVVNNTINSYVRIVHDYDDDTPLTGEDDYFEYANCKSYPVAGSKPICVTLYPKLRRQTEVLNGTALAETTNASRSWIDMAYPNVPMYGLKMFIPLVGSLPTGYYLFRVTCTAYFGCRNTR